MNARSFGHWTELEPSRHSKRESTHDWVFAFYYELASERDDGEYYKAFLFRNAQRTVFGIKELPWHERFDYRKAALRVIQDKDSRDSLVSDDSDLPKIWKRH